MLLVQQVVQRKDVTCKHWKCTAFEVFAISQLKVEREREVGVREKGGCGGWD